jgi:excisionase family DNA binding protein
MAQYLSVGEVATLLGVCEKTVYRLLSRGGIKGAFQLPGSSRWLIDRDILSEYLKSLADKPIQEARSRARGRHGL